MAKFQSLMGSLRQAECQLETQLAGIRGAIAALAGPAAGKRRSRLAGQPGPGRPRASTDAPRKRRKMSAAARKAISDAQKKRWAKQKSSEKKA